MNLALLGEAMAHQGWEIRIWAGQGETGAKPMASGAAISGLTLRRIPVRRPQRFMTSLRVHLDFLRQCTPQAYHRAWAEAPTPDVICANMAWPAGWGGQRLAAHLRRPLVVWHHGSDVHGGRRQGAGLLQQLFLKRLWRSCPLALFVSTPLLEQARSYGGLPKAALVPSMLDPRLAHAARVAQEPSQAGRYALFLGRFEPVKEPLLVLEAMRRVRDQGSRLNLRMVGQGSLREALARRIADLRLQDVVSLESEVPHDGLSEIFAGAVALVLPSRAEGMSLTLMEAAAFGVPTVGADIPGLRACIRPRESGLLFEPGKAQALAEALLELEKREDFRRGLGARARAWALAQTPEAAAAALAKALSEVA